MPRSSACTSARTQYITAPRPTRMPRRIPSLVLAVLLAAPAAVTACKNVQTIPGTEIPDTAVRAARQPASAISLAATATTAGIGAAVAFLAEGWLLGIGVALMLLGGVAAFLLLAVPEG